MGELQEILQKIQKQTLSEIKKRYLNPSIGRGEIMMKAGNEGRNLTISIVNNDFVRTSKVVTDITGAAIGTASMGANGEYSDPNIITIPKNREPAITLLQEYEGAHSKVFINGQRKDFIIKNSAHYYNSGSTISNVHVGVAGDKQWSVFPSLKDALDRLTKLDNEIEEKQKAEELARKKAEELKRQQEEESARLAAEEKRRLEEEQRKSAEEAKLLADQIESQKNQREEILAEFTKAQAFIRNQVRLRRNPVLDKNQMAAKFSHMYDGTAVVINGGPGTGKTTTMIQRLKLLIDRGDLEDYRLNHEEFKLNDEQLDYISSSEDNWIYFSPNDLLKKYLEDNMNYEGLKGTNKRTAVWKDFLKDAVRDEYQLAGNDCPFVFFNEKKADKSIYIADHCAIIEDFTQFFIRQVKDKFAKVASIDVSMFEWKILGSIITKECSKIESVCSIEELIKFLIRLEGVDKRISVNGKTLPSGSEIVASYNQNLKDLTDKYIAILKRDEEKYSEIIDYVKSQVKVSQADIDENEDMEEEEVDFGDISLKLFNKLKDLIKKLSLQISDASTKLTQSQKQLFELFKDIIVKEDLTAISHSAYFAKHINPALRAFSSYMLSPIPQYYKKYRKSISEAEKSNWDINLLDKMLSEYKNSRLYNQELSLLVGFINNMAKTLYKVNTEKFSSVNHKYIGAYKTLCRPVIGVDEATDYGLIDYYGIKSFGHYAVCSYTLCGDIMQLMKEGGVSDWYSLNTPILFENIDIHKLNISYRQSEELLKLADKIFEMEKGYKSKYECYLKGRQTPKPLWIETDDVDEKAEWISERVLEIIKAYDNKMPTIAVFTNSKESADNLANAIMDIDILSPAGIEVRVCSDNNLEGDKTLRIFPIDQVKGMEFEAAFFYDVDEIESSSLINKYLYVGLSRASMYLAVTSNGRSKVISDMLRDYFQQGGTWA